LKGYSKGNQDNYFVSRMTHQKNILLEQLQQLPYTLPNTKKVVI
jgi:hypothetical protein